MCAGRDPSVDVVGGLGDERRDQKIKRDVVEDPSHGVLT